MSDLAVLDRSAMTSFDGIRLSGQRLLAQPAVRRSLPALGVMLALIAAAGLWLFFRTPDYRPVFAQLGEADKAAVLAALQTGNFKAHVASDTGTVEVPADDVAAARIMLAGQGLPKAAASGLDVLGGMPLGSSRAVETARLKSAAEGELAASIMAIDGVDHASVHLAAGEQSVFIRDAAAPTASVFVRLAPGRTLSEAQVRAIVHLIAASVAGLTPDRVSVVDQSGALLSSDATGPLGDSARQLSYQASVEDGLRRRVVALLTPILGTGNFSTQVATDLDFAESEATRESYDKDGTVLKTDQGSSATEAGQPPARGIPGALSNTVPPSAQVSNAPVAAAPAAAPSGTRSESFIRAFEVGKAVSVTRAPVGAVRRVSVAVVVRDTALGDAREQAAQLAVLTTLVRSAVGFDARRGDVVTVAGRAFVAVPGETPAKWWESRLAVVGAEGTIGLIGLALLWFGVVRALVRGLVRPQPEPQQFSEVTDVVPLTGIDYTLKLAETKLLVGQDVGRATAVVRQMMRVDAT